MMMSLLNSIFSYFRYLKSNTEFASFTAFTVGSKRQVVAFKIITTINTDQDTAITYGKEFLESIGEGQAVFSDNDCQFSRRINDATYREIKDIKKQGYAIIPVSGCGN